MVAILIFGLGLLASWAWDWEAAPLVGLLLGIVVANLVPRGRSAWSCPTALDSHDREGPGPVHRTPVEVAPKPPGDAQDLH